MRLSSVAFADGSAIPSHFICDGEDVSPPLNWSSAPARTRSFVVLCDNPDAPAGTWHHWVAYDIPTAHTAIEAGAAQHAERQGFVPPVPTQAAHLDGSGATETVANCTSLSCRGALTAPNEPVRACRRQTVSRLGCTSCRRATSTTQAEAA